MDPAKSPLSLTPEQKQGRSYQPENVTRVIVTDFEMSFGSMVMFMVKWALAAIPALIILVLIGVFAFGILGGLFGHR